MKKLTVSIITSSFLAISSFAGGGGFSGALETTQLAQWASDKVAWAADYAKQADQLVTQANQLQQDILAVQMMVQNLEDLSNVNWTDFASNVSDLQNIMNASNALSYAMANYDTMFNDHYKGYADYYATANNGSLTPGQKALTFSQKYQQMNATNRNTVKGTLDSLNLQQSDFANEAATINTLRNNSRGAVGNKAVIQAANDISLFQVDQLRKLRQTMMSQINLQGQYMATQNERLEIQEAQREYRRTQGINPTIGDETKKSKW